MIGNNVCLVGLVILSVSFCFNCTLYETYEEHAEASTMLFSIILLLQMTKIVAMICLPFVVVMKREGGVGMSLNSHFQLNSNLQMILRGFFSTTNTLGPFPTAERLIISSQFIYIYTPLLGLVSIKSTKMAV